MWLGILWDCLLGSLLSSLTLKFVPVFPVKKPEIKL